jgi:segregation and condensation protein B
MNTQDHLKSTIECLLFSSENPLSVKALLEIMKEKDSDIPRLETRILKAIETLKIDYQNRSVILCKTPTGFQFQVHGDYVEWLKKLVPEKQEKHSQAALETLALIAYQQPITRGEIETVRGVSVSSQIIKSLLERNWIRTLGQKNVPGKPTLYGTTPQFLKDFNLSQIKELPKISEFSPPEPDLEQANLELHEKI